MVGSTDDPLHRILRGDIYQNLVELHNPHVPLVKTLEELMKTVSPAELEGIRTRANAVATLANTVVEAMPTTKAKAATKA